MEDLEKRLQQHQFLNISSSNNQEEEEEQDNNIEEELLNLIEPLIQKENIEIKDNLSTYQINKEIEKFFKLLYEQLISSKSDLNQSYNDIYWEFVNHLVRSLNQHSKEWNLLNPLNSINQTSQIVLNILEWLSLNSSPREFLLVIEEFQVSSFIRLRLFTKLTLINLSKNALKRINIDKRLVFLQSILPPTIKLLTEEKKPEEKDLKQQQQPQNSLNIETEEDEDENSDNNNDKDENSGSVKIVGPEKEELISQINTDSDLKWEYPLSVILEFIHSFITDLNLEQVENYSLNSISEQQHLFLQTILQILSLDSIISPSQPLLCKGFPILNIIGECLTSLGITIPYILESDKRFRIKKREMELEDLYLDEGLDDEDFQDDEDLQSLLKTGQQQQPKDNDNENEEHGIDDDDEEEEDIEDNSLEILWDLNLSYTGIGHLLYLLLLKSNETHKLPSVLSSHSLLMDNLPYFISLLQNSNYKMGFKAIQMINFLEKRIKLSSIQIPKEYLKNPILNDINDIIENLSNNANNNSGSGSNNNGKWIFDRSSISLDQQYHFLQLIQCMINYLVKCPVQKIRSFSYKVFVIILNSLTPDSRFNLLSNLIQSCIFPSFTGLLVHIFKEQIDHAWNDSSNVDNKAYFVSPKILEVITYPIQPGGNLMERMDAIMNGLNLYRYLLIRDKDTNNTSIWLRSQIQASRDLSLSPLKRDLQSLQAEFQSSANGDEATMKKLLASVSKMGLDELSRDEVQKASTLVVYHIDMAIDIINRIFELQDTLKIDD